jgi:hypothetical protein
MQILTCLNECKEIQLAMLNEIKSTKEICLNQHTNQPVHSVTCDHCKKTNFSGIRYKCLICKDFDLCEQCEGNNVQHERLHVFIKIKSEELFKELVASNVQAFSV